MAAPLGGRGAPHRPVLLEETIRFLDAEQGGLFVDCTVGFGGHAEAILESSSDTQVIGIDLDVEALNYATLRLARFSKRFRPVHANFREITSVVKEVEVQTVRGVLADLGVSSLQLDSPTRGFSFRFDAPLDMRMDAQSDAPTAADLLLELPEAEIARILFEFGEERRSRRIAKRIVESRQEGKPIQTTKALAQLVERAVGYRRGQVMHPATRTFQALRIAVNHELEGLDKFVAAAIDLLQPDGRFVAISFHSLEDRIIKQELRRLSGYCQCPPRTPVCLCGARRTVEILTKRPVTPEQSEIDQNPRARSARLRACRKLTSI
ncbi:MAG TPA: 16S rRNA (cytosine(1402)-N(4))-methyltransferase RsmH [Pyrinomonadaceae bacterium]|nr:16S rRNA (cytosine(1402)-N(4))-methyltransferase RsmH [Pyrinomonadaceae bacterium]